jgi:L-tyrosine C(3)-methyltransferase
MEVNETVLASEVAKSEGDDDRELYMILGGFAFFQAVAAATSLNLFAHISANPGVTRVEISRALGLPENSARVLLLACAALRLLQRDPINGGYRTTSMAERAFVRDRPGNVAPLLDAYQLLHYPALSHTQEAIRTGSNSGLRCFPGHGNTLYERLATNPDLERVFHEWMRYLNGLGHAWLQVPELQQVRHLVDVGGGTGANALLLSQFYPDLKITVFDLPSICAIVNEKQTRWGSGVRISTHAGDFLKDEFPPGGDALAFNRIFNIYSSESNLRTLKRCHEYLPPGGIVIISNMFSDDEETGSLTAAHLSLYFHVLATGEGMVYPVRDYVEWFSAAGFLALNVYRVGRDTVLVGRR